MPSAMFTHVLHTIRHIAKMIRTILKPFMTNHGKILLFSFRFVPIRRATLDGMSKIIKNMVITDVMCENGN